MNAPPLIDGTVWIPVDEPRRIVWHAVLGVCLVAALVYVAMGGPLP